MAGKQTIKIVGYHHDNANWVNYDSSMELNDENTVSGYSMPLSVMGFNRMRELYKKRLEDIFAVYKGSEIEDETVSVTFGKEAILMLLSQDNCAGITFTLGINDIPEIDSVTHLVNVKPRVTLIACGAIQESSGNTAVARPINAAALDRNDPPSAAATAPPLYEVVPAKSYGKTYPIPSQAPVRGGDAITIKLF